MTKEERAVISVCLFDPDYAIPHCLEAGMDRSWFTDPGLGEAYDVMTKMAAEGRPVDPLGVGRGCDDRYFRADPTTFLVDILGEYSARHALPEYISALEAERLGRVADENYSLLRNAKRGPEFKSTVAEVANSLLSAVSTDPAKSKETLKREIMGKWRRAKECGGGGIVSPWETFNLRFGGLVDGNVTVIAGRQGKGKSSMMCTWVHHLGRKGVPSLYIPFEDGAQRAWERIAGIYGNFSTFRMDIGEGEEDDFLKADGALSEVMSWPIVIEDRHMNCDQMFACALRHKTRMGIKCMFVDAFKDITRENGRQTEEDERMSQKICQMARRLNIPVVVNHHVRKGDGEKLTTDDVRGSGRITADCRQLILLQNWMSAEGIEVFSFEMAKNNYGPAMWEVPMVRISNRCCWADARVKEREWESLT